MHGVAVVECVDWIISSFVLVLSESSVGVSDAPEVSAACFCANRWQSYIRFDQALHAICVSTNAATMSA